MKTILELFSKNIDSIFSGVISTLIAAVVMSISSLVAKNFLKCNSEHDKLRFWLLNKKFLLPAILICVFVFAISVGISVSNESKEQRKNLNAFLSNFIEGEHKLDDFNSQDPDETAIVDFLYSNVALNVPDRFETLEGYSALSVSYIDKKWLPFYFSNVRLTHPVSNVTSQSGFEYKDGYYLWPTQSYEANLNIALVDIVTSLGNNALEDLLIKVKP